MDQAYYGGVPAADSSWSAPDDSAAFFSTAPASFSGADLAFWGVGTTPPTPPPTEAPGSAPGKGPRRKVVQLPPRERPKKETVPNHALTIAMMLAVLLDSE